MGRSLLVQPRRPLVWPRPARHSPCPPLVPPRPAPHASCPATATPRPPLVPPRSLLATPRHIILRSRPRHARRMCCSPLVPPRPSRRFSPRPAPSAARPRLPTAARHGAPGTSRRRRGSPSRTPFVPSPQSDRRSSCPPLPPRSSLATPRHLLFPSWPPLTPPRNRQ